MNKLHNKSINRLASLTNKKDFNMQELVFLGGDIESGNRELKRKQYNLNNSLDKEMNKSELD